MRSVCRFISLLPAEKVFLLLFVIALCIHGGGEAFALNDSSALADGLELRWRAFGSLDPENGDHDGDGLSDYDEVFLHGTDPAMPDTDLDGLSDHDETSVHNTCPLTRDSDGDGTRVETWEIPGFPLWSAEAETSLASLPDAAGGYPVTELLRDSAGRVTNRVLSVWKNGQPDPVFAPLSSVTEYPYGTGGHIVTTDPRGVQTVTRAWHAGGADVTETASAGVTNRVTRYFGGAVVEEKYWDGRWTRETRSSDLDTAGCRVETVIAESSDYSAFTNSITVYDFLGRTVSVTTPLGITSKFYSGASDRLVRVSHTGQPDTLYEYETGSAGVPARTVLDVDGDGQVSYSGPDRISATDTRYEEDASNFWWRVTRQAVWAETNSAACVTSSVTRVRMTGLGTDTSGLPGIPDGTILTAQIERVDWRGNVTRVSTYADAGLAAVWIVTETPGSAQPAMRKYVAGRPVSAVSSSSVTNSYTFDGFGRQVSVTDGRGNTTLISHNELGQVAYIEDAATNRTTYTYDELSRQVAVSSPLSNTVFTAYDSLGNVIRTWGATYPVEYGYDTRNLRVLMKTFRDENSDGDETRWLYDGATGLLTNKVYADGKGTAYGYTTSGRLDSRVWARGVTTDYSYDTLGQLIGIEYSDSTPDITFAYDRIGNMVSVTDASGTRVFEHDCDGQTISDTLFAMGRDFTLLESCDDFGRDTGYSFSNTVNGVTSHIAGTTISRDPFGRIAHVSFDGIAAPFVCSYLAGTDLQCSLSMPNGVTRETAFDPHRALPVSITHTNISGSVLTHRTFTRDADDRLTNRTQYRLGDETNRLDSFGYNPRSELTQAELGTNAYAYAFDTIGNRTTVSETNASSVYGANGLNQYSVISNFVDSVPSCVSVLTLTF